ncbi:G-protein coupled receptor 157-like [Lingula anatina]|uniref:G-protein coupled receptor 157-like n=1 Tax=Lingula anatina TaxID=7574 RepID=A0A1S3H7C8_LINAN|nr:G-protein coupled receptor 157-like [Lingula anatina]|eukprot:XP_013381391.1 G-protein coupled receptor 157-like [Lingula anatina]
MASNVTCGVHDFQCIASIAAIVTCILSWGGCSVIFASWILMKRVRTPNRRMLLYLTIADFFVATGQLMGASWTLNRHLHHDARNSNCSGAHPVCVAQSFVSTLATMSSFLWSMLIAWHVYRSVLVPGTGTYWLDRHRWAQHLLCWGVPLVIVVVALSCKRLGLDTVNVEGNNVPTIASGIWCWIRTCKDDLMIGNRTAPEMPAVMTFYMITGQFWVYLAFLVIPTCYIRTKRRIKPSVNSSSYNSAALFESAQEADRLMTWVPVTLLLLRMWSCVRFVGNIILIFNEKTDDYMLTVLFNQVFLVMQAVGDSAQGFTNCVLYCLLTDSVRIELKKKLGLRLGIGRDTQTEASGPGPGEFSDTRRERQHRDEGSMHPQLNSPHESNSDTEPLLRSSINSRTPT